LLRSTGHLFFFLSLLLFLGSSLYAQKGLNIRGTMETNINWFREDSLIGATGIPQYENNDVGGELWLTMIANYRDWELGVRLDGFKNSNLLNPNSSYTDYGLGRMYLQYRKDRLDMTLGYIYDQIGSGIIFRSYEERPLLIDNALVGGRGIYQLGDNIEIKGFYGRQKQLFDLYPNTMRGFSVDGYFSLGKENVVTFSPGIGYMNRLLSQETMDGIVQVLKTYTEQDRVVPKYNVYMGTIYNTLTYKGISWHTEFAIKSSDLHFDPNAIRTEITGTRVFGKYVKKPGTVWYTSISVSGKNLGVNIEAKRTSRFNVRIDPLQRLNFGLLSFIPPMNRQHTYRLLSRYAPATQDLSETALQIDIQQALTKRLKWQLNLSDIRTNENDLLYREFYVNLQYNKPRKWSLQGGVQIMEYNQEVYETKPEVDNIRAVTPFVEWSYRLDQKRSLRSELQYMTTQQDYGSWIFSLIELSWVPHWQLELSGMYNVNPGPSSPEDPDSEIKEKILYPSVGVTYTHGSKRFNIRYVKQVEGVVCTGGICRLEPAFSGLRFNSYVAF
jgi:hypothetical protein